MDVDAVWHRFVRPSRYWFAAGVLGAAVSMAASPSAGEPADASNGIAALLARSTAAWNRGDLDAFMTGYENSPETQYISAKSVVHGYANIRAHYAQTYRAGRMGTLSVRDISVRPLGAEYAAATARWHLARSTAQGGDAAGLFSLVLHHGKHGWQIILDHSP